MGISERSPSSSVEFLPKMSQEHSHSTLSALESFDTDPQNKHLTFQSFFNAVIEHCSGGNESIQPISNSLYEKPIGTISEEPRYKYALRETTEKNDSPIKLEKLESRKVASVHLIAEPCSGKSSLIGPIIQELETVGITPIVYDWEDALVEAVSRGLTSIQHGIDEQGNEIPLSAITNITHIKLGAFTAEEIEAISIVYRERHIQIKAALEQKMRVSDDPHLFYCVLGEAPAIPSINKNGELLLRATDAIKTLVDEHDAFIMELCPEADLRQEAKKFRDERSLIHQEIDEQDIVSFLKKFKIKSDFTDSQLLLESLKLNGAPSDVVNIMEQEVNEYIIALIYTHSIALPRLGLELLDEEVYLDKIFDYLYMPIRQKILETALIYLANEYFNVDPAKRFMARGKVSTEIWRPDIASYKASNSDVAQQIGLY